MKEPPLAAAQAIAAPRLWASDELPFLPYGSGAADLALYLDLLLAWNRKLNLTACQDAVSLLRDLAQDSIFLASFLEELAWRKQWPKTGMQILDLGAGAGLPGIPLRIFWGRGDYTWIERRQKRALFLQNACARLKLANCAGYCGDASDFFKQTRQKARCILSRAFMPWQKLLNFCAGQLASAGSLIIMANHEPPELPAGWRLDSALPCKLPAKTHWLWALSQS
ncbi:MAG: 16S rRNA (guanine(527)-N(7))-methyltransferase RsmG [Desulfovibrio sp.]|nr:16S rRNA (guanine(527)-N(7))-methyltransferase RsmG [Desulfovibrio sp.]